MKDKIFHAICFGFITGVFIRSFVFLNLYQTLLLFLIASFVILFFTLISKNKIGIIFGLFLLSISFGITRFHYIDINFTKVLDTSIGTKVELTGLIVDAPEIRENNQRLTVKITEDNDTVKILASASFGELYKYGDEIKLSGKLLEPENFITDTGKEFDYVNYLKKDGILYIINYPEIEIISHGNGNKIKSTLFSVKEKFLEKINFSIREPESLLMGGLILGDKAAFDESLRESFINTGTIHIVALSGYNITIVAEWIMKLFVFLPINFGIGIGILAIILFILLTGASSTAIRAGIMATLALIARALGRDYDISRALILTAVFMVFFNPLILVYDVSFQLSFIATVAVIYLSPKIEKYFYFITKSFGLRDIISVTCSAYIFVMPFILYKMGTFSIVALPANVLILPFIPFTMLLGFLTGFVGLFSSTLALPFGLISFIFLHYELFIIKIFASFPFAAIALPNFPLFLTVLIYVYFIYRLFGRSIKNFFE